jgi:hypothetical protein
VYIICNSDRSKWPVGGVHDIIGEVLPRSHFRRSSGTMDRYACQMRSVDGVLKRCAVPSNTCYGGT